MCNRKSYIVQDLLLKGMAMDPSRSSYESHDLDWSYLSVPSNLYKVNLNDDDDMLSSVDTDCEDEVFYEDFDMNSQSENIKSVNNRMKEKSLDSTEKVQVIAFDHSNSI